MANALHHACAGKVEEFVAPTSANYKLEVWGAQGGTQNGVENANIQSGLGGYSYGNYNIAINVIKLFVCIGAKAIQSNTYNNRTNETIKVFLGGGRAGGGATHIATAVRGTGELSYYYNFQDEVLIVAGGGGSAEWKGTGGYGGGTVGGDGVPILVPSLYGTGGQQNKGGSTHKYNSTDVITEATFGVGGYGCGPYEGDNSDYGTQGGGGWYGGGGTSIAGCSGGGSGHIGAGVTGETIAGNTSFPSPSGGTETGHTGNGYAIIRQR